MVSEPEYAQNIVVGVLFQTVFSWYISEKEYWYLDYTKYNRALLAAGHTGLTSEDYEERCHIAILDENTAKNFLACIRDKHVPTNMLSQMMLVRRTRNEHDDLLDFSPCLLVNFDQRQLSSQYPEMIRFEKYVPDGWISSYRNFLLEIPVAERYWIVDGKNLFSRE